MRRYLGYIRVSTQRQGEGVSLEEQKAAIERYAHQNNFSITSWFEEKETAAKQGRPVFSEMLRQLRQRKADGVVIHKIDRSARNLRDWADIGDLIEQGIEVHFAHESLDIRTRGGRLAADIQAVVAADYIRNLRDEIRKGFYGRLKQGLYPLGAPTGYVDNGSGKPKTPDPRMAPLVQQLFEDYDSGRYSLDRLVEKYRKQGLKNKRGRHLSKAGISKLLKNPFYCGTIRLRKTGETFEGIHQPLISIALFERVKSRLEGRTVPKKTKHDYSLRKMITCADCGYRLIGERQKGRVYYRCQTRECSTTTIREDRAEEAIKQAFATFSMTEKCGGAIQHHFDKYLGSQLSAVEEQTRMLTVQRGNLKERLQRLTESYLDQIIDKDFFLERKAEYLAENRRMAEQQESLAKGNDPRRAKALFFLELAKSPWLSYKTAIPAEKRVILEKATSNRTLRGKELVIEPVDELVTIGKMREYASCGLDRDTPRTLLRLFDEFFNSVD